MMRVSQSVRPRYDVKTGHIMPDLTDIKRNCPCRHPAHTCRRRRRRYSFRQRRRRRHAGRRVHVHGGSGGWRRRAPHTQQHGAGHGYGRWDARHARNGHGHGRWDAWHEWGERWWGPTRTGTASQAPCHSAPPPAHVGGAVYGHHEAPKDNEEAGRPAGGQGGWVGGSGGAASSLVST